MNARDVKKSFGRVKEDINMLKNVQSSYAKTVKERLDSDHDELSATIEHAVSLLQEKQDNSVRFLKDSMRKQSEDILSENTTKIVPLLNKMNELFEMTMAAKDEINHNQRNLNILTGKLQELDNLSMDVEDMEKVFVQKADVRNLTPAKDFKKLSKNVDKLNASIYDITEEKQGFATVEQIRHIEESVIDLKDSLVLRNDIEQISSRIDTVESKLCVRIDRLQESFDKIENDLTKVYALKKEFVSKDQHKNLRKEMKLLILGLKDIQKLKNQIKKLKKA